MPKWKVSVIQHVEGGPGFVLYDANGRPCVSFAFKDEAEAKAGHVQLQAALADVRWAARAWQ